QRRTLNQLDIGRCRVPDRFQRRDPKQGHRHAEHAGKNKGQAGQQQGAPGALDQILELLDIHVRPPYKAVPSLRRRTKTNWPNSQNTARTSPDSARYTTHSTMKTSKLRKVLAWTELEMPKSSLAPTADRMLVTSISSTYWLVNAG